MIWIIQHTRLSFNLIHTNAKRLLQLKQHHQRYLNLGKSIYVFKLMTELHRIPNVPNQENWIKLLIPLFIWYHLNRNMYVPEFAKGSIIYFGIFHDRTLGSNLRFWKPEKLLEGEDIRVQPTLVSALSRYQAMVNYQGVMSRKNYVPRVTIGVTKTPIVWWIGAPIICPFLVVCCIHIYCRSVCVWFRLLSLACILRRRA